MIIKDPEQIYEIFLTPDEKVAMRITYGILLDIMNKFSSSKDIVAMGTGEAIEIHELSRTLGIIDGLMRRTYWRIDNGEEE